MNHLRSVHSSFAPSAPKTILVVDDDPIFGRLVHAAARRRGINVVYCHSAAEMANAGALEKYDAILVDYFLGSVRGSSVARFLSTFYADTPVIMVSSSSHWWHSSGGKWPMNVKRFVHKDRSFDEMMDLVDEVLAPAAEDRAIADQVMDLYEEYSLAPPSRTRMKSMWRLGMAGLGQALIKSYRLVA